MLLQPRSFKHKKKLKLRKFIRFNYNSRLTYGYVGALVMCPISLTGKKIFRLKLFLKRSSRKSDKTHRYFWFNAFPHLPLTRKTFNSRMGKGKGKFVSWRTKIAPGTFLFEFKNLRLGRALFFIRQVNYKMQFPLRAVTPTNYRISLPFGGRKKLFFKSFW